MCTHMNAIHVTLKETFERLYLVPELGTFGPQDNCPYAPTTPTVHTPAISRFLCNFFPRMAPHFFCHHDSPSNLAETRYPPSNPLQNQEKVKSQKLSNPGKGKIKEIVKSSKRSNPGNSEIQAIAKCSKVMRSKQIVKYIHTSNPGNREIQQIVRRLRLAGCSPPSLL